jgi:putative endonuclease
MKNYYVYILTSKRNGTIYIGVTSDLVRRIDEHKRGLDDGFTNKYHCHQLVYLEEYKDIDIAITREKQMKEWKRKWKLELIEKLNPEWRDLWDDLIQSGFRLSPE